jgi:hypothetical protein
VAIATVSQRRWKVGLAAVLLLAAGLRIYSALTEAIEVDELFTRDVVSGSVRAGVAMTLDDRVHPPLHYVIAKVLSVVSGTSPEGLRLLSVLCGITLVAFVAFVARALFADVPLALTAAALVALSDWQILVSHFARSYSLFDLVVLLAGASLWMACQAPLDRRFWIAYVVAGSAAVNTNYLGWLYLASMFPVVALCGMRVLRRWLLASGIVVSSFLPWTFLLVWYAQRRGGFASKFASLDFHPGSRALVNTFAQLNGLPAPASWAVTLTVLFGGVLFGLAVARAIRTRGNARAVPSSTGTLIMAGLAVLPPCLLWFITRPPLNLPLWGIRHLTPSIAPWVLVTCAGVSLVGGKKPLLRGALAASLVILQSVTTLTNTSQGRFFPFHKIAHLLVEKPAESPTIYLLSQPVWGPLLQYYLPRADALATLPGIDTELPSSFWLVYRPEDGAEQARLAALLSRGWSVTLHRDYEKRVGIRGVLRAALIARQGRLPESVSARPG